MLWLRDMNAVADRIILRKVWGQERSPRKGEAGEWQELIFAVKRTLSLQLRCSVGEDGGHGNKGVGKFGIF